MTWKINVLVDLQAGELEMIDDELGILRFQDVIEARSEADAILMTVQKYREKYPTAAIAAAIVEPPKSP